MFHLQITDDSTNNIVVKNRSVVLTPHQKCGIKLSIHKNDDYAYAFYDLKATQHRIACGYDGAPTVVEQIDPRT